MRGKLLLLFLLTCIEVFAQPYYFRKYQVDDGLSHNTVNALLQDRNGMIWIGTKSGLNSFNGYTFKTYQDKHNLFGTIGNNNILSLCEDRKGILWVGTGRGLYRYDPQKESFREIPAGIKTGVDNILADRQNNIWWLNGNTLCRYDQSENKLTVFPNLIATSMAFDKDQKLWMGDSTGCIRKLDMQKLRVLRKARIIDNTLPRNLRGISTLLADGDNIMVGTTKKGLKNYNMSTGRISSYLDHNPDKTEIYVRDIIPAGNGKYWVATESGIYIYDVNSGQSTNLRKTPENRYSVSDNAVYCLMKDKEGGFWAGTYFGGLNYLSQENVKFEKYCYIKGENSISGNAVREICSYDDENLWIGTEDAGLNRLNLKTGKFTNYTSTGQASSLSYFNVHGLSITKDRLYIGQFLHGLDVMDVHTGKIIEKHPLIEAKGSKSSDFLQSICQTKAGEFYCGTYGAGVFKYNPQSKDFTLVEEFGKNTFVFDLAEDHSGTIWLASIQIGALYYNPKTGEKGAIRFGDEKKGTEYQIQGIFEDRNNFLWFTTDGGGLIRLDPQRKNFVKFTTNTGFPSNYLFRILEDKSGNLWISSLKGLICFDPKTTKFRVFNRSNGLITDQFNYNSAYKAKDGKMYFGTVQGMIAFYPEEVTRPAKAPEIYITDLQVNNKDISAAQNNSILKKSILYTDTLSLNYDQASFNLEFAAFSFSSSRAIRYSYKMMGADLKDWTYLKTNQKAYFTDLSPGTYTFLVRAESNVGKWSAGERRLVIEISPPFWKSSAAYLFYILVFGAGVYLLASSYRKYLERKNLRNLQLFEFEKEKEIYQAKIEFFTNIAHEIQTPLTLIKGPIERIMKRVEEVPSVKKSLLMIEKNTNRLLALTSQLLDFRKTEINQFGLNFVNLDITEILKQEVEAFRPEAEKRNLKLSAGYPKEPLVAFVDYEAFTKVISNLLSNAVKYAESKVKVELSLPAKSDTFTIRFINDGEPIAEDLAQKIFEPFFRIDKTSDRSGTGIGLPIARSLTELHNGTLNLLEPGNGLIIFEVVLPVHHSIEFNLSKWKKQSAHD